MKWSKYQLVCHIFIFWKIEKHLVLLHRKQYFFLIIAVEPLRSCFFWKMRVFHRFHGWGNVQLVFKQNRPLWERAFLGALCTCNGLVCSLQSHLCSVFSFYKDKTKTKNKKTRNKKKKTRPNKLHLTPLPLGVQSCFFVFLLSWFVVSFEGLAKSGRIQLFATFPP